MCGHVKRYLPLTLDAVQEGVEDGELAHGLVSGSVTELEEYQSLCVRTI